MKGFARVIVVFLTLIALAVGFVGGTVVLDVTQPANKNVSTVVNFEIQSGDDATSVAQRLQADGLIRSDQIFIRLARFKKLNSLVPGTYHLSPSMSMNAILNKLLLGKPDVAKSNEIFVNFAGGLRATQYPAYLTGLSKFDAKEFLTIAKTGIEPDGTKLWQKYWYIKQPIAGKTAYALEGYLDPKAQYFFLNATATDVIEKLVSQFGIDLCPGPISNPALYITSASACRAHAIKVGGKNIFDLMRKAYPDAKDDVTALSDTLIIASFSAREIDSKKDPTDFAKIVAAYHNRYINIETQGTADTGYKMGADPSVYYARDTLTPPTNGKWWVKSTTDLNLIAPKSPYNTYTQAGMPPGPIDNPYITEIEVAAAPQSSPYYYFVADKCGKVYYATNLSDFNNKMAQASSVTKC